MTYDAQLYQSLSALGLPVEPILDSSVDHEYITYSYESEGTLHGDDGPCLEYRRWTVVYSAPIGYNRLDIRKQIQQAIWDLFGVWPSEDDASDVNGQRWIYEFDTVGGISCGED